MKLLLTMFVESFLKRIFFVFLTAMMLISVLSFSLREKKLDETRYEITFVEKKVREIQKFLAVDNARAMSMKKIKKIIFTYNKQMAYNIQNEIANEIYNMSVMYANLDINLICATITHETARSWRPEVVSPAGAMGLMQIMPYTGYFLSKLEGYKWTNAKEVLFDPVKNIHMGCRYLSMLVEMYHVDGGLAAYNGGESRAAKWLASGRNDDELFEETRSYVPAVLHLYNGYKN